ncbi:MarR family winged helix-turn-helix transcriptional regulator [Streptomyces sp. WAC08241]|uniref:MarR family winged helix-turn-helix transcriptional regulator n=1 Tax=Streptomyces sp. WAC08241 TaxID=2487421 RepID=UPI000F76F424|nr:MarR family transcriptional regulator [Streptomyces sp. WAC08241]RSS45143.1 MarR family transcriptional regulator [Streptomyces sp. WAC08241]
MQNAHEEDEDPGPDLDEAVRTLLLLMPRTVARVKRLGIPEDLRSLTLAPRHLSLLARLLLDGPLSVNGLAARLEVAPTTASLMVGDLARKGVLERVEDPADRRRKIVSISERYRAAIDGWLGRGADAWRAALAPLDARERRMFIETLAAYERGLTEPLE